MKLISAFKNSTYKITPFRNTSANGIKCQSTNCVNNNFANKLTPKSNGKVYQLFTYIKGILININKADIKRISKLPVEQFLIEVQKLIAKSKGYDAEFMAPFVVQPFGHKQILMLYNASTNTVHINSSVKLKTGAMLYALMCHEYEHFHQNLQILRTSGLSEKAITRYSKMAAQIGIKDFQELYKNITSKDLPALKEELGQNYNFVQSYINAKEKSPEALTEWISKATENDEKIIRNKWEQLKNLVIEKYGEIAENSEEAQKANKYYESFMKDSSLTGLDKNLTISEFEAYFSTVLNFYNYLFKTIF